MKWLCSIVGVLSLTNVATNGGQPHQHVTHLPNGQHYTWRCWSNQCAHPAVAVHWKKLLDAMARDARFRGAAGKPGRDAPVDYDRVCAELLARLADDDRFRRKAPAAVDAEELAKAVAGRLPPLIFEQYLVQKNEDGTEATKLIGRDVSRLTTGADGRLVREPIRFRKRVKVIE